MFSFTYPHLGRLLLALVDPTSDGIDEDTDFFLKFVAENACSPDWRDAVKHQWVAGGPNKRLKLASSPWQAGARSRLERSVLRIPQGLNEGTP